MLDFAEWNGVQRAAVMPKLHRAQGYLLDGPFYAANVDVFGDAEGIIHQEKRPGKDIPDQRLCAETDGKTQNPGTGKEWSDIDAKLGKRDHAGDDDDDDEQEIAEQRQ